MDIALYISDLLKDYDEISLPGVGVFYKKKSPASFDEHKGSFAPPSELIAFSETDSAQPILVDYVCAIKKISEASSRYFINKFTESIKQSLASTGKAELAPLGQLVRNARGLELIQDKASRPAQFGLPVIQDPAFSGLRAKAEEREALAHTEVAAYREKSSGTLWQALIIVFVLLGAALGAAYYYYPDLFRAREQQRNQPKVNAPLPVRDTVVKDSTDTLASSPVNEGLPAGATPDSLANIKDTTTIKKLQPSYEIISASLALRSEAETYLKLMQSKGIKAKIIEDTRRPKFKVSIGSYTNYEQANLEKRRIQKSFNKEAWILTLNDKAK